MPRIRTVKPEFWDSPSTARASLRARLFFIAMWNWADDYGRGTANPKALIGFAFPNDDDVTAKDFPTLRKEVADCFGVVFYEVGGRPFYAIPSWDKHQRTERKAKGSIPEPPQQTSGVGSSDDSDGSSDDAEGSSGTGTGEQGNRGTGENTPSAPPRVSARFDEFWNAYPRKTAKDEALRKYKIAARKVGEDFLVDAAVAFAQANRTTEQRFIPHPATWLHQGRYGDPPPTTKPTQRWNPDGTAVGEGKPW